MADDKRSEQSDAPAQAPLRTPVTPAQRAEPPTKTQQQRPAPGLQTTPTATMEYSDEQKAAKPESFQFIDTLLVEITVGPWRGMIAHLPNADAQQAIADKWAVDYQQRPADPHAPLPPPLTDEEMATARDAAQAYADSLTAPPDEVPPEGEGDQRENQTQARRTRDLQAGRGPGYETRSKE